MTTTTNDNILMMFEEINQKLDDNARQLERIEQKEPEKNENNDFSEFTTVFENFEQNQSKKLSDIESLIRKEKRKIELSPNSVNTALILLSLMVIVLGFLLWNFKLQEQLVQYKDNDLKYRYVLMQSETEPETLSRLESIFESKSDSVKIIRRQVEIYEKNLMKEFKLLNKARLKEMEAESLKKEAENYKRK